MHSQVAELQRLGTDAHVVCEHTENLGQFDVANIHCLINEPAFRRVWDRTLRRLRIRRHLDYLVSVGRLIGAHIVHSHFGHIGWANLGAVQRLGAKHVVTFYGLDVNKLPAQSRVWRSRYYQLFEKADLVLCEGTHMAQCIMALGCPHDKLKVQHLGVDVERIEFRPRQWLPGEPLRVLIAASFREKKGIPYAVEALGLLCKQLPVLLTLIGDADAEIGSRREKQRILNALQRAGLASSTRMLGYQSHDALVREAYRHHLFLQPSITASDGDTEGGAPVSIIEMLATGMPVVSSRHCDIPEVVGPELQFLLAPERDVHALVSAILTLLEKRMTWEAIAIQARRRLVAEYNRERQGRRLVEIYSNILRKL